MKFNQSLAIATQRAVGIAVIILGSTLGACAGGGEPTNIEEANPAADSPVTDSPASPDTISQAEAPDQDDTVSQGGQVIESGPYHLELVPITEASGVHLDFYLQKGDTHEAISDAQVTAQIQFPDGSQESIDMDYDSQGRHYTVLFPATVTGDYNVAILSDISGEKVNGRFTFTK